MVSPKLKMWLGADDLTLTESPAFACNILQNLVRRWVESAAADFRLPARRLSQTATACAGRPGRERLPRPPGLSTRHTG